MSFWVYILRCADHFYYTGHTDNLEVRITQHQAGETAGYTAARLPVKFFFQLRLPSVNIGANQVERGTDERFRVWQS